MSELTYLARRGLWALPVWAVLQLLATATHQPPYQTRFAAWSGYVTTPQFLVGHLVASILGAAIGLLGFTALTVVLVTRGAVRLGTAGLVTFTGASAGLVSVFGVAAFAQPAIGRSYRAGHAVAHPLYDDVNGAPLLLTALLSVLLFSAALVCFAVGARRTGLARPWAAWCLAVGAPLFSVLGVALADVVQSVGALLMTAGVVGIAVEARRAPQGRTATGPAPARG